MKYCDVIGREREWGGREVSAGTLSLPCGQLVSLNREGSVSDKKGRFFDFENSFVTGSVTQRQ